MSARPFIKSVGGKTQLLPELLKRAPSAFGTYHEPFVGGGALFWALQPAGAILNDKDDQLITAYAAVRDSLPLLLQLLTLHAEGYRASPETYYYAQRERHNTGKQVSVGLAASVIFLSKTGFNGLRRVNKAGQFNTPWCKSADRTICDVDTLSACSAALRGVHLTSTDFQSVAPVVVPGDFVYFDSPYAPVSKTADFTAYTAGGFSAQDQVRLRDVALALKERGVHVMLSNACTPLVEDLYSKHFVLERVNARRAVNSDGAKRGAVGEYIIR